MSSKCIMLSPDRRLQYRDKIMLGDQGVAISPDTIYGIVSVLHNHGVIDNVNDIEKYAEDVKRYAIEHGLTEDGGIDISADITNQLVGHLNDLGIETHGSKDMEEDLRWREEALRMSEAKAITKPYNEVKANQKAVSVNKLSKNGYNVNPHTINDVIITDSSGHSIFTAMRRTFILCNVNGNVIPFYQSSRGTDGKIKGDWYPFFGYTGNWLIKGGVDSNGKMSYSSGIDYVTELLNRDFRIPTDFDIKGISRSTGMDVRDLGLNMYTVFDRYGDIMQRYGITSPDAMMFYDKDLDELTNADALFVKEVTGIKTEGIKQSHHSASFIKPFIDATNIDNIGTFSTEDDDIQFAFAGSQLTFAHGIKRPHGEDLMLLSSAIMTQSNTFGKLTSELADKNDGTVVKKVILYGNHAYLWSTENGYEFFVEQSLAINEENYQKINDLLDTYGTDEFTAAAISGIQRSGDKKTGSRSLADFAKRERSGENSGPIGRNSRRLSEISNGTGADEHNLSDTQGKTNFITPQGQVYGYATPEGAIYLDERVIKPEHPIHEYTHLWDRVVRSKNDALWNRGVELMKQTSLWNEYLNHPEYGQRWIAEGKSGKELDDLIASEVHARLVGKEGESLLLTIATEKGSGNIISKLKQWILDFWKELGKTLGVWTEDELKSLTLDDFINLTIRDFAEGAISGREISDAKLSSVSTEFSIGATLTDEEVTKLDLEQRKILDQLEGADKLIADDILRNNNDSPVALSRDRFIFYLKSGLPIAGMKTMIDAISKQYPDRDPYEVLADFAFESYNNLAEKYKDGVESLWTYTGRKLESIASKANVRAIRLAVKNPISKLVAWCLFGLKRFACDILTWVADLIRPQRRFNGYGDVVMYSILLGSRDFVSVHNKLRGRWNSVIDKNIKEQLVSDYIQLDNKVQLFFKNDGRIFDKTEIIKPDGSKITYRELQNRLNKIIDGTTKKEDEGKTIVGLLEELGVLSQVGKDFVLNTNNPDSITTFNIVMNEIGFKFGLSLNDMCKIAEECGTGKRRLMVRDGLIALITKNNFLGKKNVKIIKDAREAMAKILSFRKTEATKVNNLLKAIGNNLNLEVRRSLVDMQRKANDLSAINELDTIDNTANSINNMVDYFMNDLTSLLSKYRNDTASQETSDGVADYLAEMNRLYNKYIAVMEEMSKDLRQMIGDNKNLFRENGGFLFNVLSEVVGTKDKDTARTLVNAIFDNIFSKITKNDEAVSLFNSVRTEMLEKFYANVADEHNLSSSARASLVAYAHHFKDDISFVNRYAGFWSETKNQALQIAANKIGEAASRAAIKSRRFMLNLDRFADKAHKSAGITSKEFVELDDDGVPTGYFISKYKIGEFEKEIDNAYDVILEIINNRHNNEVGYPIGSVEDITTLQQKKEFATLFSQWKFHGSKVEYDSSGKPVGFSGDRMIDIDLSIYKVGENANISNEEALRNAEEHDRAFNNYDDYNYAILNALREQERVILSAHNDGSAITSEEKIELDAIAESRRRLGSIYNIDGTLKSPDELEHVKNFNDTRDKLAKLKPTAYNEDKFNEDFNQELERISKIIHEEIDKDPTLTDGDKVVFDTRLQDAATTLLTTGDKVNDEVGDIVSSYVDEAMDLLYKWTSARRFKKTEGSFYRALSKTIRKDKGFNMAADKYDRMLVGICRAAINRKRVSLSRIALSPDGTYVTQEINDLEYELDLAYDNIIKSTGEIRKKYKQLGIDAMNDLFSTGDNKAIVETYIRSLSYINKRLVYTVNGVRTQISNLDDADINIDSLAQLIKLAVGGDRDAMKKLYDNDVLGVKATDPSGSVSIEDYYGEIEFDSIAETVLKPHAKVVMDKLLREREDNIKITKSITASAEEKRNAQNNIDNINKKIDNFYYTINYGYARVRRYRSSLSTVAPIARRIDVDGFRDEDLYSFGYSSEYIIRASEDDSPSVRGLRPNKDDSTFINPKFDELMSKPDVANFYNAMIAKKEELDIMNGMPNPAESKLRIPIKEVEYKETNFAASASKLGNALSVADRNLTNGQYLSLKIKEEGFSIKSQSGILLKRAITPMSRRLEDMRQCSTNLLNSMTEYSDKTFLLDEHLKAMDVTESIMGGLASGSSQIQSGVESNASLDPGRTTSARTRQVSDDLNKAVRQRNRSYSGSQTEAAYNDIIDTSVFGIYTISATTNRTAMIAGKIIRAVSRLMSACLIKTKALQSGTNTAQVVENVQAKQIADPNVHSNKIRASKYQALDVASQIADNHRFAKRSKVGYLFNIFGLSQNKKFDRIVKAGPLGGAANVLISGINDFVNEGLNLPGTLLVHNTAVLERMFDFAILEYTDNGEKKVAIVQKTEYEAIRAKLSDEDAMRLMKFSQLKRLPDVITMNDGFPDIEEGYKEVVENNAGRIGQILRAYSAFLKSAVSQDEQGKLFTDPSLQSVFVFRTWILPKFYQLWGHTFTGASYNYRDKKLVMGVMGSCLSRMLTLGIYNPLRNAALSTFDEDTRGVYLRYANRESTLGFVYQVMLGAWYTALSSVALLLRAMDPDGDDRKTWWRKYLEAWAIKTASEHFDTTTMLGILPTFNKISYLDILAYAFFQESVEGARYLANEAGFDAEPSVHKSGEYKNALKAETIFFNNFVPFSDVFISGNDRASEIHYLVGNGGAAGLFYQFIQDMVVNKDEINQIRGRLKEVYENEVRTGLQLKDTRDSKIDRNIIQYDVPIIAQGLLALNGISYNDGIHPEVNPDKYVKNGKPTLVGKAIIANEVFKKVTNLNSITSYYAESSMDFDDDFEAPSLYDKDDSNYMKIKAKRMAYEVLNDAMKPYDTKFFINMADLTIDGLRVSEGLALNGLKNKYKDHPDELRYLLKKSDEKVANKMHTLINGGYERYNEEDDSYTESVKWMDLLDININDGQYKWLRDFVSKNYVDDEDDD